MNGPNTLYLVLNEISSYGYDAIFTDYYIYAKDNNYKSVIKNGVIRCLKGVYFNASKINKDIELYKNSNLYNEPFLYLLIENMSKVKMMDLTSYVWLVNSKSESFASKEGINLVLSYTDDYFNYLFGVLDFLVFKKCSCDNALIKIVYEIYSVLKSGYLNPEIVSCYQKKIKESYGEFLKKVDIKKHNEVIENTKNYIKVIYKIDNTSVTFEDFLNEIVK